MSGSVPVADEDLHAFIDGELPPDRAEWVAAALERDPGLAQRAAAFAADKAALADAYRIIAETPLPEAWLARIHHATTRVRPATSSTNWLMALAACLVLAVGSAAIWHDFSRPDDLLAQAEAVRENRPRPVARLQGPTLGNADARDATLTRAVGLKLQAPDLAHLGWRLRELDTYPNAAALRYYAADGRPLTLFVRRSTGAPRFDMLKDAALRTCVWQDEVTGGVIMGRMSAGEMERVAAAAYTALRL
jgi:anti-sigma factor RsiW